MKRLLSVLGVLVVFLLVITSNVSAASKFAGYTLNSAPSKSNMEKQGVKGLNYSDYFRGWHDWYYSIINKPFYLHLDDVFIGKLVVSRDNRLEISAPLSDTLTSRITIENHGMALRNESGHPNLGLGIASRMSNGVSLDTSVNFDLSNPSDVTILLSLPAIRF